MNQRIPVIVAMGDFAAGPTSWAFRLRQAFEGHPAYEILLANCYVSGINLGRYDATCTDWATAVRLIEAHDRAMVVPNFIWDLYAVCNLLRNRGRDLRVLGFCRADSDKEYYRPLSFYEPGIDQFIAVSQRCHERLAEILPHRSADITTLPTGVWTPPALDRAWETRPVRLMYAGRIVQPQKRVMDLALLVRELAAHNVDFKLTITGLGEALPALEKEIKSLGLQDRACFAGRFPPDQMPALWASHDIMVQTSEFEGTSNSMIEAMAQGCVPVVTRTASGVADIIHPDNNGHLFDIGDMKTAAGLIADLAAHPGELARMGRAAHQSAQAFSMPHYVERFTAVMDAAMKASPHPWPVDQPLRPAFDTHGIGLKDAPA